MTDEFTQKPKETVAIAADHGGFALKIELSAYLEELGYQVLDLGTDTEDSVDYPDFAYALAEAIEDGRVERGILICGSGIGISMAANRSYDVRAAVCHDVTTARLTRIDNDANVLCMGARVIGNVVAKDIVKTFLETRTSDQERHQNRIKKLASREG